MRNRASVLLLPLGLASGFASGWCFLRSHDTGVLFVPGVLFGIVVLWPFLRFAARPLVGGVVLVTCSTLGYSGAYFALAFSADLAGARGWGSWSVPLLYGLAGFFGSGAISVGVQRVVRLTRRRHTYSQAKLVAVGTIGGAVFWVMVDSGPQLDFFLPAAFTVWQGAVAAALMPYFNAAQRRVEDAGHFCKTCDYDLTGNASGVCPECGTKIEAP